MDSTSRPVRGVYTLDPNDLSRVQRFGMDATPYASGRVMTSGPSPRTSPRTTPSPAAVAGGAPSPTPASLVSAVSKQTPSPSARKRLPARLSPSPGLPASPTTTIAPALLSATGGRPPLSPSSELRSAAAAATAAAGRMWAAVSEDTMMQQRNLQLLNHPGMGYPPGGDSTHDVLPPPLWSGASQGYAAPAWPMPNTNAAGAEYGPAAGVPQELLAQHVVAQAIQTLVAQGGMTADNAQQLLRRTLQQPATGAVQPMYMPSYAPHMLQHPQQLAGSNPASPAKRPAMTAPGADNAAGSIYEQYVLATSSELSTVVQAADLRRRLAERERQSAHAMAEGGRQLTVSTEEWPSYHLGPPESGDADVDVELQNVLRSGITSGAGRPSSGAASGPHLPTSTSEPLSRNNSARQGGAVAPHLKFFESMAISPAKFPDGTAAQDAAGVPTVKSIPKVLGSAPDAVETDETDEAPTRSASGEPELHPIRQFQSTPPDGVAAVESISSASDRPRRNRRHRSHTEHAGERDHRERDRERDHRDREHRDRERDHGHRERREHRDKEHHHRDREHEHEHDHEHGRGHARAGMSERKGSSSHHPRRSASDDRAGSQHERAERRHRSSQGHHRSGTTSHRGKARLGSNPPGDLSPTLSSQRSAEWDVISRGSRRSAFSSPGSSRTGSVVSNMSKGKKTTDGAGAP